MTDRDDLNAALRNLSVDDVSIDPLGRVVLKDPDVARLLGQLRNDDPAARTNYGCCTNGALCKPPLRSELREMIEIGKPEN